MSKTEISWTDYSLNPGIYGCSPAHSGCDHCYAAKMARRLSRMAGCMESGAGHMKEYASGYPGFEPYCGTTEVVKVNRGKYGPIEDVRWTGRVRVDYDQIQRAFDKLPKRKRARVFVTSMGDLFHERVEQLFAEQVLREFERRPNLTGQILTKRARRLAEFAEGRTDWPANVWAGVSCSTQADVDRMVPDLLRAPAAVRFLSLEPLLGPVDLRRLADRFRGVVIDPLRNVGPAIDWVIVGCESGPRRRPCSLDWVHSIVDQCRDARVPVFVKQIEVKGKVSRDPSEWPWNLRAQEFPEVGL